jgi:hypothetical protein
MAAQADDSLASIEDELDRIGASEQRAGELDSIGVNDESDGWASLGASERRHDFYWYGRTETILARLRTLATDSGPAAVRGEFRSRFPG